ncbi:MAG: hypothetical protein LBI18_07785 [Planctomycetaceae bacterium]|nr:hypothetical protein [Planctomycetaceae bacterium]
MFRRNITLPQGNSNPVLSWQSDSKPLGNTNCQPNTRAVMFRRNITHLVVDSGKLIVSQAELLPFW